MTTFPVAIRPPGSLRFEREKLIGRLFRRISRGQRPGAAFTGRIYDRTVIRCSTRERSCSPAVPHISQSPFWMPFGGPSPMPNATVSATSGSCGSVGTITAYPTIRGALSRCIARCNPILDQGAIVAVHPVLEKAAGELASRRRIDRPSTGPGRDQAYPKPSSIGPAITCQGGRWGFCQGVANASPNRKAGHNQPRAAGSDRQRPERPSRTQDATCAQNAGHHAAAN
ncbi:hypothetical protein ACVWXO_000233 [Bradyrhizobium sp. LM2.7]